MPQVPRYTPQEQLRPLPTPRVDAEAFGSGVGRAVEQAGNRLMSVGDSLGNTALKLYEQVDQTAAKEAYAKFLEEMRGKLHGENGFFSRRGKNAVNLYRDGDEALRDMYDTISGELKSERQKKYFHDMSFTRLETARDQLSRHEAEQLRVYEGEVTAALITQSANDATANYTDMVAFNNSVSEGLEQITVAAATLGLPEEAIALKKEEYLSGIHVNVINQMLASPDTDGTDARAWYEGHKDEIKGSVKDEIEKSISGVEIDSWSQNKATELFRKYGLHNEQGARAEIDKKYKGERAEKLISKLEARYVDERRFNAEREKNVYDGKKNALQNAKTLEEALKLAGDEESLIKLAHQMFAPEPVPYEDQLVLYEEKIRAIENGEYSGDGALLKFHKDVDGRLDEKLVGKLETQLIANIKGEGKGEFKGYDAVIDKFKADNNYKAKNKNHVTKLAQFRQSYDNFVGQLEENAGRKLNEKEKYEAGINLMEMEIDVAIEKPWWFDKDIFNGKLYEVDQSYVDKAVKFLNENGLIVNMEQITMAIEDIMLKENE